MGSATAMLARKMLAAKGTDNRQIADGNIALQGIESVFRKGQEEQRAADHGRGNLRRPIAARRRALVGLVRERVFTLRPDTKKAMTSSNVKPFDGDTDYGGKAGKRFCTPPMR